MAGKPIRSWEKFDWQKFSVFCITKKSWNGDANKIPGALAGKTLNETFVMIGMEVQTPLDPTLHREKSLGTKIEINDSTNIRKERTTRES